MGKNYTERLADLRERAHRICEAAREDPAVPPARRRELEMGLQMVESGWETVQDHPNPAALAEAVGLDLDEKIDEWESNFDDRERELGLR